MADVFILGGTQTDFALHWSRSGRSTFDMMGEAVLGALQSTGIEPAEVQSAHIGNFTGELFSGQGHLGGFFVALHPDFAGVAASRHEAACASGSMAILAAMHEIQAGHCDLACVVGIEEMRNVPGKVAADNLACAAWRGREATESTYVWPAMFSELADFYDEHFGLDYSLLAAISQQAFENARCNPNAQSRGWRFDPAAFGQNDEHNPIVEGRLRRLDCGQISDGAAVLLLASESFAARYCASHAVPRSRMGRISGFSHKVATMLMADKLGAYQKDQHIFPHMEACAVQARSRAGLSSAQDIGAFEVHDCFSITELVAIEHLGLSKPGQGGRLVESGAIGKKGAHPINPGGGLIGAGHPVGATGVRMMLDAYLQVTEKAGDMQVEDVRSVQTLNLGGSATTVASFVVERA